MTDHLLDAFKERHRSSSCSMPVQNEQPAATSAPSPIMPNSSNTTSHTVYWGCQASSSATSWVTAVQITSKVTGTNVPLLPIGNAKHSARH